MDSYPYLAGNTTLHAFLPSWMHEGGTEATLTRLRSAEIRDRLRHEMEVVGSDGIGGVPMGWEMVQISGIMGEHDPVLEGMRRADYIVAAVKRGTRSRRPSPPFTTSTLQQDASRRVGFTARKTMAVAQQLYEGVDLDQHEPVGLITYMRTDSPQVSQQSQQDARRLIAARFGPEYVPEEPPVYRARTRGAQEAHEAIRPTSVAREPQQVASYLTPDQLKLYTLVWNRFVASQMKPAEYDTQTIEVEGKSAEHLYGLRAAASSLRFAGFLDVYEDRGNGGNGSNGENGEEAGEGETTGALPEVEPGDALDLADLFPDQHFTVPPPRYTEATLVKAMEELGIGRP
jgi:DNA topoisomerase-1